MAGLERVSHLTRQLARAGLVAASLLGASASAVAADQKAGDGAGGGTGLKFGDRNAEQPVRIEQNRHYGTRFPIAFLPINSLEASVAIAAAGAYHGYRHVGYDLARDITFRADNPLRVYVEVVKDGTRDRRVGRERSRRGRDGGYHYGRTHYDVNKATARARRALASRLPGYVFMVGDRRDADMVFILDLQEFETRGRVVDIDRRSKKYKKSRKKRNASSGCGLAHRAHYERVEERLVGRYVFGLKIRERGEGRDLRYLKGRVSDSFRFGRNLQAETACGLRDTRVFPNSDVRRLFERDSDQSRAVRSRDLRRAAEREATRQLLDITLRRAERHYRRLANRYRYDDQYGDGRSHHDQRGYDDRRGRARR